MPPYSRNAIEDAMDAYDEYRESGKHSDIFSGFRDPRDYWVRSTRERPERVYASKPIVAFAREPEHRNAKLNGGWGPGNAAAELYDSGYIIVGEDDTPVSPPEKHRPHLIDDEYRIGFYAANYCIEPAREEERELAEVSVRDVNEALGLNDAWSKICQALTGQDLQELAQVPPPARIGGHDSPAAVFRFDLGNQRIDRQALEQMRNQFLAACPDFKSFVDPGTGWAKEEKEYKLAASERVQHALESGGDDETLGKAVFEILKNAAKDGPLVRWQTEDTIAKHRPGLLGEFYAIIGRLIRSHSSAEVALLDSFDALEDLRDRGAKPLTYGERLNIVFSALAMVRPGEAAPIKITLFNDIWRKLTEEKLFVQSTADMASDYRRFSAVFSEIFMIMRDDWKWQPQDWLDIQGFLWIAADDSTDTNETWEGPVSIAPTNLILYGPPGTGKTYRTTAEQALRRGSAPKIDQIIFAMQGISPQAWGCTVLK